MRISTRALLALTAMMMAAGCRAQERDAPAAASASASLRPGALRPSALQPSALRPSALQPSALQPSAPQPSGSSDRLPPPKRTHGMVDRWGYVEIPARVTFGPTGDFDLVIHFHGGGLHSRAEKAELDAVLVSATLGDGSGLYAELFSQGYTLEKALSGIERAVRKQTGLATVRVGRLALSSFSAGYGSITSILRDPKNDARIDALLMADGLHVDFKNVKHRQLADDALAPYLRFGRAALRRDKLFLVTHSQIPTGDFASTSETAAWLVDRLKLPTRTGCARSIRLRLASCYGRGGMVVAGYYGTQEEDHMDHAYAQHSTMYRALRKRWTRRAH